MVQIFAEICVKAEPGFQRAWAYSAYRGHNWQGYTGFETVVPSKFDYMSQ